MNTIIKGIFGTLMAIAMGVVFFAIAYAGVYWWETGSLNAIKRLDGDMYATLKMARADITIQGQYRRTLFASSIALVCVVLMFVLMKLMTKKQGADARFLTVAEVIQAGLAKPSGVFVGRAGGRLSKVFGVFIQRGSNRKSLTKPRLKGGRKVFVDGDDVGGFVVGPPRSGKGAALIVPNALIWPDSMVVLDMRGETYQSTAGYRSKFSKVVRFAPADEDGETECYNPLDFISLDRDQRDIDIRNVAASLFPRPATGDTYWVDDGRILFSGVISYVMETPRLTDDERTLRTAIRIMNGVERPFLDWINGLKDEAHEISDYTLQLLSPFGDMSDKQFSGLFGSVRTGLNPFMNERLLRATSKSTFDIRNLKRERVSIYLDFRIEQINSIGPLFNMLITQLMNFMSKSVPGRGEHRVLIMLDEFQNLGKLENVMQTATILGGYGVPTWFYVQSLKSVDAIYREEGRKTLVNSARVQVFFGAQDAEDLKYISDTLGERTELKKDVSKTAATMFDTHHAKTTHWKEQRSPLMRPDEIRTMSRDKCIIVPRGSHAILGTRNFYFADKDLIKRAWLPIPKIKKNTARPEASTAEAVISKPMRMPDNDLIGTKILDLASERSTGQVPLNRSRGAAFMQKADFVQAKPALRVIESALSSVTHVAQAETEASTNAVRRKKKVIAVAGVASMAAGRPVNQDLHIALAKAMGGAAELIEQTSDPEKFASIIAEIGGTAATVL